MSDIALAPEALPQPIPLRELWPWLVFAGLIALIAIYFVGAEQGATSLISGTWVHELPTNYAPAAAGVKLRSR